VGTRVGDGAVGDASGVGLSVGVGVFGCGVGEGDGNGVGGGEAVGVGVGVLVAASARAGAPSAATPIKPRLSRRKKPRRLSGKVLCRRACTDRV